MVSRFMRFDSSEGNSMMKSDIAKDSTCRLAISQMILGAIQCGATLRVANSRRGASCHKWQAQTFGFDKALAIAILLQIPGLATAQMMPPAPGIAVEGIGELRTVPDVVEINLRLVARGELTDDAVVKHRDARKRTMETFQALKLDNLKLEEKDLTLRPGNGQEMMQMMMWGGMPASQNKRSQIEVGSMLRARLTNVNKVPTEDLMSTIGKLIDAAQDSGAGLGISDSDMMMMRWYGGYQRQSALVKFVVTNLDELREKAYEMAVADARKRAERLARLNGVKLGSVVAIDELETGGGRPMPYYYPQPTEDSQEKSELVAESLSGGKITVHLRVRFAIDPAGAVSKAAALEPTSATPASVKGKSP
jgi:hypothetical protein